MNRIFSIFKSMNMFSSWRMFILFSLVIFSVWRVGVEYHAKSTLVSPKIDGIDKDEFMEICESISEGDSINSVDNLMPFGTRKISINRDGVSVRKYWIASKNKNVASPIGITCDVTFLSQGLVVSAKLNSDL